MTMEIITEKFDVLRGRLLGNQTGFHWLFGGQINHQPCSRKAARVTSEKSFIPYKASATVQAIQVCPVRPRVLSGWGIPLIREAEGCR